MLLTVLGARVCLGLDLGIVNCQQTGILISVVPGENSGHQPSQCREEVWNVSGAEM